MDIPYVYGQNTHVGLNNLMVTNLTKEDDGFMVGLSPLSGADLGFCQGGAHWYER